MKIRAALLVIVELSGCTRINDWANRNMPVIGERCYNWQCMTEGGQAESRVRGGVYEARPSDEEVDAAIAETTVESKKPVDPNAPPAPAEAETAAPETRALKKRDEQVPPPPAAQ
jgi:hypothetical protein